MPDIPNSNSGGGEAAAPYVDNTLPWKGSNLLELLAELRNHRDHNSNVQLDCYNLKFVVDGEVRQFIEWMLEVAQPATMWPITVGEDECAIDLGSRS